MSHQADSVAPETHPFDAAIQLEKSDDGHLIGHIHAGYANFVGPFGGVITATLLNAVMQHPDRIGEPLSLTVNFAAPIADEAFEVRTRIVRTGGSTQHWIVELIQREVTACSATAVFAVRRKTWSSVEAQPPGIAPAQALDELDSRGFPAWVAQYQMHISEGDIKFGSAPRERSHSALWIRDRQPRTLDFLSLASMSDAFFPRLFVRRQRVSAIGTVSMTTFFHATAQSLAAHGAASLLAAARGRCFHDGFFDQSGELWDGKGQLLASTHQIVYYKD